MSGIAGALAVLLGAGPAEPTPPPLPAVPEISSPAAEAVRLRWDAPSECPREAAVRSVLAGYLGEEPAPEVGAAVLATAKVTLEQGAYRLELRTETPSGVTTRQTTADDCMVLVDATALIVAIAVDPSRVMGRAIAEPEPEPVPEPTVEAEPAPEPLPEPLPATPEVVVAPVDIPPAEPERRVRYGLRVGGGLAAGLLPGLAGGLRLTGTLLGARWRAEVFGDYWFPRAAVAEDGIGGRVSAGLGGARGCWQPGVESLGLEFPVCAGLEGGVLRGDPVGDRVAAGETSRQPWLGGHGSAALAWAPRRFIALVVRAELVVPILRAGFRVGEVEVYRAGPVAGRGVVGLEARFP